MQTFTNSAKSGGECWRTAIFGSCHGFSELSISHSKSQTFVMHFFPPRHLVIILPSVLFPCPVDNNNLLSFLNADVWQIGLNRLTITIRLHPFCLWWSQVFQVLLLKPKTWCYHHRAWSQEWLDHRNGVIWGLGCIWFALDIMLWLETKNGSAHQSEMSYNRSQIWQELILLRSPISASELVTPSEILLEVSCSNKTTKRRYIRVETHKLVSNQSRSNRKINQRQDWVETRLRIKTLGRTWQCSTTWWEK